MNKKKIPLLLVPVILLGTTGTWLYHQHFRGDPNTLHLSGNVEAVDVELSFRIAGWVQTRPVDEGQMVKAGQVTATLESAELEHQVALNQAKVKQAKWMLSQLQSGSRPEEIQQAKAVADRARSALEELEHGSRPEEIQQAEAAVREAQAELSFRKQELDRVEAANQRGAVTTMELQQAESAHRVAVASLDQAQQKYNLVKLGPRAEEVDQAKAALAEAQQKLALAQKGPREEEIQRASASLDQAQADLLISQTRLEYATLHSPLSGMVLSKDTEPGEYVSAGTPIITVADLGHVYVRAYVAEPDLQRISLGQKATITTDAVSGKKFEGRVSFIASEAEFTPKNVQTEKERVKLVYRIKIDIDNPQFELKPGMPADADIALK